MILAGFASELTGNEGALVAAEPVVEIDGRHYVAPSPSWTRDALIPLSDAERDYVRWIRPQDRDRAREGEVVWLAGRDLFAAVSDMTFLREFALAMGSARWALYGPGFRWRTGTLGDLQMTKRSVAAQLRAKLYELLGDALEKSHGDASKVFDLYLRLDDEETADRFLAVGLYYFETHNWEALDLTRFRAVRSTLFENDNAFDSQLTRLRDWINEPRLSATMGHRAPSPRSLAMTLMMERVDYLAHWGDLVDYSVHADGHQLRSKVIDHFVRAPQGSTPWIDE